MSHCRASKSQSVGIALQNFQRTVKAHDLLKPRSARNFCKQACPSSYDRHMSIMFDWSSHSRAPFAGEWRFSKSRGLSASVSFLSLPHPVFLTLALAPILRGQNTVPAPFLGLSLLPNPMETLACPNFAQAKYHFGSVPWSFFAPQPHGNACYAGYS